MILESKVKLSRLNIHKIQAVWIVMSTPRFFMYI